MIRYACKVAYVGRDYEGWQTQGRGNTIQEKLESVLTKICDEPITIIGSGRTDSGVNARGQVFHFDTHRDMSEFKWYGAINAFLPDDIRVLEIKKVPMHLFHARYSVRWKKYSYRVNTGSYDVFQKDTVYQLCRPLNLEKMEEASKFLIGTHDFTSFNASPLEQYPDQTRSIYHIDFQKENDVITMAFVGKGFLRYMVRMLSAILIEVGKEKIEPEEVRKILERKTKTASSRNVPPNGLTLEEVKYFQTGAFNDEGMIREYLEYDKLPENLTMEELLKEDPVVHYALTKRKNQSILAYIEVEDESVQIQYLCEEGRNVYQQLEVQFLTYLKQKWTMS